jgi:hypothetical protein
MQILSRRTGWIAALALAALVLANGGVPAARAATDPATPPAVIPAAGVPVAHSALLTIDATPTDDGVALHIKHAGNQIPIDGQNVTVSIDGKQHPVTPQPEGTFLLSTKDLSGDGERQLDIVVAHDGIREILTGKITLPKVGSLAGDLWHDHKQMAWWILNITVVLIAVLAFSNRSSKPKPSDEKDD